MPIQNPEQGEIWIVQFDPAIGDEISKTRPAVVLSRPNAGKLALRYVMPITDWKDRYNDYPWMEMLVPTSRNGLQKISAADAFQCKLLSLQRFVQRVGTLNAANITELVQRLLYCLKQLP